jgi:hypothetical protein
MTNPSFSNGRTDSFTVATNTDPRRVAKPYDANFTYHRLAQAGGDRPKRDKPGKNNNNAQQAPRMPIYLIDPQALLRVLQEDNLPNLHKLTLLGSPGRNGVHAMWDVLFNMTSRNGLSACIYTATDKFEPIPRSRVSYCSNFLDYSMSSSRIQLSQIESGDRIGIALNDVINGVTYILLSVIDGLTNVLNKDGTGEDRHALIPAVNITVEQILRIDDTGTMTVDMDPDNIHDHQNAAPFVQRLYDSVYDITEAYPWKPHFVTIIPQGGINVAEVNARIQDQFQNPTVVSYQQFEDLCRQAYQLAYNFGRGSVAGGGIRKRPAARNQQLPKIEVVTTNTKVYIAFEDNFNPLTAAGFDPMKTSVIELDKIDDLSKIRIIEPHLCNADVNPAFILEDSTIFHVKYNDEKAVLRYFELNF